MDVADYVFPQQVCDPDNLWPLTAFKYLSCTLSEVPIRQTTHIFKVQWKVWWWFGCMLSMWELIMPLLVEISFMMNKLCLSLWADPFIYVQHILWDNTQTYSIPQMFCCVSGRRCLLHHDQSHHHTKSVSRKMSRGEDTFKSISLLCNTSLYLH